MISGSVEGQLKFLSDVLQQAESELCSLHSSPERPDTLKKTRILERQAKELTRSFARFDVELANMSSEILRHLSAVAVAKETSCKLESTSVPRKVNGYRTCGSPILPSLPISLLQQFFLSMDALCTWQERQVWSHVSDLDFVKIQGVNGEAGTLVRTFQAYLKKLANDVN